MKTEQLEQENIEVPKEVIDSMIRDFERLLKDFERITERETMRKVDRRLREVKEGKVKGLSEKDYVEFLRRKGIDAEWFYREVPSWILRWFG